MVDKFSQRMARRDVQLDLSRFLEAIGPHAALDVSLVGPFLARASGAVTTPKGMPLYEIDNGTAIITVEGPLARKAEMFWGMLWMDGYDRIQQAVEKAAKDPDVEAFHFQYDTPGGQAQGLGEGARAIRAALDASGKPSVASVSLAASAGYWLAATADEIFVEPDGAVGSIGIYVSHYDLSRALDKAGITITHIQDPEGKTAGTWTKPLDDEARAQLQEVVSMLSQSFYEHVSSRRGMTSAAVRDLNARVFYGQKAIDAKLADGILSFSAAKKRAGELAQKRKQQQMSELASFLGLPASASAEDIKKAADEAKPLLNLGCKTLALTGESSADAANGVIVAWKKDAADADRLRADAAKASQETDAKTRHSLLVALAQVEPPSQVWKDPRSTSLGPVQELAEMSTASLQSFVERRTSGRMPEATKHVDPGGNAKTASDEDVKLYAQTYGVSEFVARAALAQNGGDQ